jgi:type II secretory pathway component PulM
VDDKHPSTPLTRRQFLLLSLSAAAAATVPAGLAGSAPAAAPAATPTPPALNSFVQLSALLTGIDAQRLAPEVDPVNIKQVYFDQARKEAAGPFDQLLTLFDQNQSKPPDEIADIILTQSGAAVGNLARTIMLLWYLGSWYPPSDPTQYDNNQVFSTVVSAEAYVQGWVWRVAQAHPMGFSPLIFGHWGKTPPALSDFIKAGDQA